MKLLGHLATLINILSLSISHFFYLKLNFKECLSYEQFSFSRDQKKIRNTNNIRIKVTSGTTDALGPRHHASVPATAPCHLPVLLNNVLTCVAPIQVTQQILPNLVPTAQTTSLMCSDTQVYDRPFITS